jgi:hypothetical protein
MAILLVPSWPVIPYNLRDEREPDTGAKSVYSWRILHLAPWHIGLDLRLTIIVHANFLGSQMTIAQIVYDNERSFGYDDEDIHSKVRLT